MTHQHEQNTKVMKRSAIFLLYSVTLASAFVAVFILRGSVASAGSSLGFLAHPLFLLCAFGTFLVQESLNPFFASLALKSVRQATKYVPQLLITVVATSANSTVPVPAGIPIRAYLQNKLLNIPYSASANAILIELTVGYGLTSLAAVLAGILWFREAFNTQAFLQTNVLLLFFVALILTALLALCAITYAKKHNFGKQLSVAKYQFFNAELLPILAMVVMMLVTYALALIRFEVILFSLKTQAPVWPLLGALLLSRMAGVLSLVPMGLGVREASLASLLLLIGIPGPHAAAAVALDRLITTIPYLGGCLIATHYIGKRSFVTY